MTIDTQKLREALDLIEYELQASYNNAKPVCCGHGYGECCGNPEPGWDAGDQKIMDVLGPIQRTLSDAVSQADAQAAEIAQLREAQSWQPIETAPKDGTEILAWRADCGQFIASYTSPSELPISQAEIDALDEETLFAEDWFTQWPQAQRLEGSEVPTQWMPLPAAPDAQSGESNG